MAKLKTLQNFYKTTISTAWAAGTGNRYVSALPTPTAGYLVVNPSNSSKREIVEYNAIGSDGGGNYVTLITRGVGGTSDIAHDVNEPVRMNYTAELYAAVDTELEDLQTQINDAVIAGAPNASTSVKGISKLSVAPASATEPIAVGDNDVRVPTADPDTLYTDINEGVVTDDVTAASTLEEQTTSTGSIEAGEADATLKKNSVANSYTASKPKIRGVKLYKKADTGTFTGTVTVSLMADSSGAPSGTALASEVISNADWLALSDNAEFDVIFDSEYASVVDGDTYWIDVQPSTADNLNFINLGADTSAGDGSLYYNNTTDGWVQVANGALYYKIMEGIENQIVKTGSTGQIDPAVRTILCKVGSSSAQTSGTTTITHNLGVIPSLFRISLFSTGFDSEEFTSLVGVYDGTTTKCNWSYTYQGASNPGDTYAGIDSTYIYNLQDHTSPGDWTKGLVTKMTKEDITITWSSASDGSGTTKSFIWEVLG